jgi:hypothetical protein
MTGSMSVSESLSKPKFLPGLLVGLDHPGRAVGLVLVAVRDDQALLCFPEKVLEGVERLGRAEPGELVGPEIHARLEMVFISGSDF